MQAVPIGFFLFLVELAAGGWLVTAALDWGGEVSAGFLFLNRALLLVFGVAGVWLRSALPAADLLPFPARMDWLRLEVGAWVVFLALGAAQLALARRERWRAARLGGTLAAAAGLAALGASALAYRPPTLGAWPVLASFLAAALALGTVWSGMMLGHWYLVSPRLAPRPLLRLNAALAGLLIVQAALTGAAFLAGGQSPDEWWLFGLRGGVGILFPLVLAAMVWRTARARSMMSATGLLYIALGAVLAGEIIAKALFFMTQTVV